MRTLLYSFWITLLFVTMGVPGIQAQHQADQQQPSPQQPPNQTSQSIPAVRSPLASGADNDTEDADADLQKLVPDNRPLAGAQDLSLGAPATSHNYWRPFFDVGTWINSNPAELGNNIGWTTWTTLQGGMDLHHISGNSDLSLNILSGGSISNGGGASNTIVEELTAVEKLSYHRTVFSFVDQLSYLPEASFGYSGVGGLGQPVVGGWGVTPGLVSNQSILTAYGQNLNNTALIQANTFLTPRSSLTFIGSYGILKYFDNNLNNTEEAIFQAGYNYQLNRKDKISLFYRFDGFRYDNITQSIDTHSVQLAYARQVTGRWAFQVSGGPVVSFSQTPITASSGSLSGTVSAGGSTPSNATQLFWSLYTTLTYQWRPRTSLWAYYYHGVTGGSGVLGGAVTDNASGGLSYKLTRMLNAQWTAGYSRNTGVNITTTSPPTVGVTPSNQTYDYWFTGVNLNRNWGRSTRLSLGYTFQYQGSNGLFCVTAPCGTSYSSHQIFLSLGWHPRPYGSESQSQIGPRPYTF